MSSVLILGTTTEQAALQATMERAQQVPEIIRIVVFGSRVRGDFRYDSDLDLLVVVSSIEARDRIIHLLYSIEEEFDVPLSPVIYTAHEYSENRRLGSPFIGNVEREGKMIYDAERK